MRIAISAGLLSEPKTRRHFETVGRFIYSPETSSMNEWSSVRQTGEGYSGERRKRRRRRRRREEKKEEGGAY